MPGQPHRLSVYGHCSISAALDETNEESPTVEGYAIQPIFFGTTFCDGKMYASRAPRYLIYLATIVSVCQFIIGDVCFIMLVDI